jgi:RNA polymerase sigma factor (TIGR02999 family)
MKPDADGAKSAGRAAAPSVFSPVPVETVPLGNVSDLARLLASVHDCDPQSAETLLPQVYEELRRVARHKMAMQPPGHTLQPTALVHEAFLRMLGNPENTWENRRHFFASASEAMRHILVDRARRKNAVRHGGDHTRINLDDVSVASAAPEENVLLVNDALSRLAAHDAAAAELVKLRFFGGFTFAQAAELLEVSERTAKRMWAYARAWLFEEIRRTNGEHDGP